MSVTYNLSIRNLECLKSTGNLSNVVVEAHWHLTAADGPYSADCYGAALLPEANGASFTPYENLTHDEVVSWVESIAASELDSAKENLASTVAKLKANPAASPELPWVAALSFDLAIAETAPIPEFAKILDDQE